MLISLQLEEATVMTKLLNSCMLAEEMILIQKLICLQKGNVVLIATTIYGWTLKMLTLVLRKHYTLSKSFSISRPRTVNVEVH